MCGARVHKQAPFDSRVCLVQSLSLSLCVYVCVSQRAVQIKEQERSIKSYPRVCLCSFGRVFRYIYTLGRLGVFRESFSTRKKEFPIWPTQSFLCVYLCVLAFVQFYTHTLFLSHERRDYTNDANTAITTQLNSYRTTRVESKEYHNNKKNQQTNAHRECGIFSLSLSFILLCKIDIQPPS